MFKNDSGLTFVLSDSTDCGESNLDSKIMLTFNDMPVPVVKIGEASFSEVFALQRDSLLVSKNLKLCNVSVPESTGGKIVAKVIPITEHYTVEEFNKEA